MVVPFPDALLDWIHPLQAAFCMYNAQEGGSGYQHTMGILQQRIVARLFSQATYYCLGNFARRRSATFRTLLSTVFLDDCDSGQHQIDPCFPRSPHTHLAYFVEVPGVPRTFCLRFRPLRPLYRQHGRTLTLSNTGGRTRTPTVGVEGISGDTWRRRAVFIQAFDPTDELGCTLFGREPAIAAPTAVLYASAWRVRFYSAYLLYVFVAFALAALAAALPACVRPPARRDPRGALLAGAALGISQKLRHARMTRTFNSQAGLSAWLWWACRRIDLGRHSPCTFPSPAVFKEKTPPSQGDIDPSIRRHAVWRSSPVASLAHLIPTAILPAHYYGQRAASDILSLLAG